MNGILLVNKQSGITSYDVIRMLKKKLSYGVKIGHAGTLDPFATGLLIILLGSSTKLMDAIQKYKKGYLVKAQFGFETETQDITGKKTNISESDKVLSKDEIEEKLTQFIGTIMQSPPKYSAVKIKGKRAYDLARENKDFETKPKEITVHNFIIKEYEWPFVKFEIDVSSGTYVRTLIVDLARSLGTYATALELERTYIGEYDLTSALNSREIENVEISKFIIEPK